MSITPKKMNIHTLSLCIPPALSILITKINDTALDRYSMSFGVTSPDPPMPGVSTSITFPYGSYRNILLLRLHAKQLNNTYFRKLYQNHFVQKIPL